MKTSQKYSEIALQNFENGMNCAQAVLCAFSDETGLDSSTACKIALSFGSGMGHLGEVCGALSAIFVAAGMVYGCGEPSVLPKNETRTYAQLKAAHYKKVQKLAKDFKDKHDTYICRELLASPHKKDRSSCVQLVSDATKIFATMLIEDEATTSA